VRILDPYAGPGVYRKAQLHCHTRRSDGRFEPADLARRYRDAGYSFVCFTDHDVVTRWDGLNTGTFAALPGVEETVTKGLPRLGPHLGRLLVSDVLRAGSVQDRITRTLADGGVPCLHHPSWTGNLWTGAWSTQAVASLRGPFLVEIWNPHSASAEDTRRWARAVQAHGPDVRIGCVAADDCHNEAQFDRAWVMVKTSTVTADALRAALLTGAFYASTGVEAVFGVEDGRIVVHSNADEATVFDGTGAARARLTGGVGSYAPAGDEGFVRVECRTGAQNAWSQVFWILSGRESVP
jgi:hypothetical protein